MMLVIAIAAEFTAAAAAAAAKTNLRVLLIAVVCPKILPQAEQNQAPGHACCCLCRKTCRLKHLQKQALILFVTATTAKATQINLVLSLAA